MRPQDNYNIITGEVRRQLPINSTSKRFQSLNIIKNEKLAGGYDYSMPPVKKLGKPKDDKLFTYTYTGNDPINNIYKTGIKEKSSPNLLSQPDQLNNNSFSLKQSLINATKQDFNIISNTMQFNNAPNVYILSI
jgi:hypothetical protein